LAVREILKVIKPPIIEKKPATMKNSLYCIEKKLEKIATEAIAVMAAIEETLFICPNLFPSSFCSERPSVIEEDRGPQE